MLIKNQLIGGLFFVVVALALVGYISTSKMKESAALTQILIDKDIPELVSLFKLHMAIDKHQKYVIAHTGSEEVELAEKLEKSIDINRVAIEKGLQGLKEKGVYSEDDERIILEQWDLAKANAKDIIQKSNDYMKEDAIELAHGVQASIYEGIFSVLDKMIALVEREIEEERNQLNLTTLAASNLILNAVLFTILVLTVINGYIVYCVLRPMKNCLLLMENISKGNLDSQIKVGVQNEFGILLSGLRDMQQRLKRTLKDIGAANKQYTDSLDINERITQALDKTSASIVAVDADGEIIYVNESAVELFSKAESDFQSEIPGFSASSLVGSRISLFEAIFSKKNAALRALESRLDFQCVIGVRSFHIVVNPVLKDSGQSMGIVMEWTERTKEIEIETSLENLVSSAQKGNLKDRIQVSEKSGFLPLMVLGINQLLSVISNAFQDIAEVMGALSKGNLTKKVESRYTGTFGKVKDDVNATIDKLRDTVLSIRESVDQIASVSQDISAGNENLSSRTEEQAGSLRETSSNMEALTSTVQQNAGNAKQAQSLAQSAQRAAQTGGEVVGCAIEAMSEIGVASNKIATIVGVINEIAFQTNLLALNASIEAAHAGEHGRGFAVVATEVRNLAQRSAESAQEIQSLILDSVEKVEAGSELVNRSGQTLHDIVESVQKVSTIITEIANSSEHQAEGIVQIDQAISSMEQMTQQNASLAEQMSAASLSMNKQANQMSQQIKFFNL